MSVNNLLKVICEYILQSDFFT